LHRMDGLAIATTTLDRHLRDPLGANWLPVLENARYPLVQLPSRGHTVRTQGRPQVHDRRER
jgi:hypothetical protein